MAEEYPESGLDSMLRQSLGVSAQKQRNVAEASQQKQNKFNPLNMNNVEHVDGDTWRMKDTQRLFRASREDPSLGVDTFESDPQRYHDKPDRFYSHRRNYAKLTGKPELLITADELAARGKVQAAQTKQRMEDLGKQGFLDFRVTGQDVYGRDLVELVDNRSGTDFFANHSGREENASYDSKYNSEQILRDFFTGERGRHEAFTGSRSWKDMLTDQPVNLAVGAGRMVNDLAQGASILTGTNTQPADNFFAKNRERLEGFKERFGSNEMLARDRLAQGNAARAAEMFEVKKQDYMAQGMSENEAKFKAGLGELGDTIKALLVNPGRILDATVESLPYMVGVGAVGRVAINAAIKGLDKKIISKVTGLVPEDPMLMSPAAFQSTKLGKDYLKKISDRVGATTVGVTEGLSNSASVYNSIVTMTPEEAAQSETYQSLRQMGKSHREAVQELATDAFASTLITNTLLAGAASKVTGAGGLEARLLTGKAGIRGLPPAGVPADTALKRALASTGRGLAFVGKPGLREAGEEFLQSGGGEFLSQLMSFDATGKEIGPGIGAAAGEGAVVGLASGAVLGGGTDVLKAMANAPPGGNASGLNTEAGPVRPIASVVNPPPPPPGGAGGGGAAAAAVGPRQEAQQQAKEGKYDPSKAGDAAIDRLIDKLKSTTDTPSYDDYEAVQDHYYAAINAGIDLGEERKELVEGIEADYKRVLSQNVAKLTDEELANPSPETSELLLRAGKQNAISEADRARLPANVQASLEAQDELNGLEEKMTRDATERSLDESKVMGESQRTIDSVNREKMGDAVNPGNRPGIGWFRRELGNIMADPNKTNKDEKFIALRDKFKTFIQTQRDRVQQVRDVVEAGKDIGKIRFFPQKGGQGGTKGLLDKMEEELADIEKANVLLGKQYQAWTGSKVAAPTEATDDKQPTTATTPDPKSKSSIYIQKAREIFNKHGANQRVAEAIFTALETNEGEAAATEFMTEYTRLLDQAAQQRVDKEKADKAASAPKPTATATGGRVVLPVRNQFTAKDQAKSDQATKFIGRGSSKSSTNAYANAWGSRANSGVYTSDDVVFISAEGSREGRLGFNKAELQRALDAGATIITDNEADRKRPFNVGEREVAAYLTAHGYTEVSPGRWQKATKAAAAKPAPKPAEPIPAPEPATPEPTAPTTSDFVDDEDTDDDLPPPVAPVAAATTDGSVVQNINERIIQLLQNAGFTFVNPENAPDMTAIRRVASKKLRTNNVRDLAAALSFIVYNELKIPFSSQKVRQNIEDGIAEWLVTGEKPQSIDQNMWVKVSEILKRIINVVKGKEFVNIMERLSKELDELLVNPNKFSFKPTKGKTKTTFQAVLNRNLPVDQFFQLLTDAGVKFVLTGSMAYADQTSIYRNLDNPVHDIDVLFDSMEDVKKAQEAVRKFFGTPQHLYSFTTKEGTPIVGEVLPKVTQQVRNFKSSFVTTIQGPRPQRSWEIWEGDKKVGSFAQNVNKKTGAVEDVVEGDIGLVVDYMIPDTERDVVTQTYVSNVTNKEETIQVSSYVDGFEAKLLLLRPKDVQDLLGSKPVTTAPATPVVVAPPVPVERTETQKEQHARRLYDAQALADYIANNSVENSGLVLTSPADNAMLQSLLDEGVPAKAAIEAVINSIEPDPTKRNVQLESKLSEETRTEAYKAAQMLNEDKRVKAAPMPTRWQNFTQNISRYTGGFINLPSDPADAVDAVKAKFKELKLPLSLSEAFQPISPSSASLFSILPDVMAVITDPAALRGMIKELNLTPQEGKALLSFAEFYPAFAKKFSEVHRRNALNKKWGDTQLKEYPLHYFETATGEMDPNVLGAMALEAMIWWTTSGPRTIVNDDETIRAILGRRETDPITWKERQVLQFAGSIRNQVVNDLGPAIARHLNIAKLANQEIDPVFADKVITDLGGTAISTMLAMKLLKTTPVSKAWFNNAQQNRTGLLTDAEIEAADRNFKATKNEPQVTFIRNAVKSDFINGKRTFLDMATSVREAMEGGYPVFARLFGVDARVKPPSFQKPLKAPTKITGSLGDISPVMQRRMLFNSQRAWRAYNPMMSFVGRFDPLRFLQMTSGYIPEAQIGNTLHKTQVDAAEGRNRGLVRDIEAALAWHKQHSSKPFYFLYRMISTGRVYIDSNVINPQASKLHRYMFAMDEWEQAISTANAENMDADQRRTFENFQLAIGMGLGVKVGRLTREDALIQAREKLASPEMQEVLNILNKEGKIEDENDLATLEAFIKQTGEEVHAAAVLNAWHMYTSAPKNSTVTISIPLEIDGVTNGYAALMMQLVGTTPTSIMKEQLRGVGLSFKGDKHRTFAEYLKAGGLDNYQDVALGTQKFLKEMADGNYPPSDSKSDNKIRARVSEIISSKILPNLAQLEEGKGRNWAKNPLMVVAYGSSLRSVVRAITENALEEFYAQLAQAGLAENPAVAVAEVLNSVYGLIAVAAEAKGKKPTDEYKFTPEKMQALADLHYKGDVGAVARNLTLRDQEQGYFEDAISATYGEALSRALSSKMQSFEGLRSQLNHANKLMNIIFVQDFKRRVKTLQDTGPSVLGPRELRGILEDMWKEGMVPSVPMALNSPDSLLQNMDLTHFKTDYLGNNEGSVRSLYNQLIEVSDRAFEGVQANPVEPKAQKGIVHQIVNNLPDSNVGVAAVVGMIHGIDGTNNSRAWGYHAILNTHDGATGHFNLMDQVAEANNAELIRIHSTYSIPDAITEALGRMTGRLRSSGSQLTLEAKVAIYEEFKKHLSDFKYGGEDYDYTRSGSAVTQDFVSKLLTDVNKAAENKRLLLADVIYSSHFSKDGGEAAISDPDERVRNPILEDPKSRSFAHFIDAFRASLTGEDIAQREQDIEALATALQNPDVDEKATWFAYLGQGRSSKELFDVIQAVLRRVNSPAGPLVALLNNMVTKYIGGVPVTGVESLPNDAWGKYYNVARRIDISQATGSFIATAIHEMLHAATVPRLEELEKQDPDKLRELFQAAVAWGINVATSKTATQWEKDVANAIYREAPDQVRVVTEYFSYLLTKPGSAGPAAKYALHFLADGSGRDTTVSLQALMKDLYSSLADPKTGKLQLYSTGKPVNRNLYQERYDILEPAKMQQIFEDLAALDQGPASTEHQQMLSMVLQELAIPGVASLGYPISQVILADPNGVENIGEIEGDQIRLQAAGNKLSSNVDMSLQETALHEYVHAFLQAAINTNHFVRKEAIRLYTLAKDKITVQDFLPEGGNHSAIDLQRAQERYDHIFNNPTGQHYHEFMAIGLTNMAFAKALQRIDNQDPLNLPQRLDWSRGILNGLLNLARVAFQWVSGQSRRTSGGSVHQGMYALAKSVIASNQRNLQRLQDITDDKDKTVTDHVYSGFDAIDRAARELADKLTEKLADATNPEDGKPKFDSSNPTVGGAVKSAMHSAVSVRNPQVRASYDAVYRSMGGKKNNFFFDIAREVTPWQGNILNWVDMLMKSKSLVDRARQQIIQNTESFLKKSFDRKNYLDQNRKRAITRVIFNTDMASLMDGDYRYTISEMAALLNDPALVTAERVRFTGLLQQELAKQNGNRLMPVFEKQMDSLANYLTTSVLTVDNPLLNAHNIVQQVNLDARDRVPLKDKDALIGIVDKLVTLKALEQTSPGDIKMSLDMVNHEMARTDVPADDNGFARLLGMLGNFKDMSREKLFDEQPYQMIKGYVYEIFDGDVNIEYVNDTPYERARMEAAGMKFVAKLPKDRLLGNTGQTKLLYKGLKGLAGYNKSIVSLTDMQHRGVNLFEVADYRSQVALKSLYEAKQAAYKASKDQFNAVYNSPGVHMVPVFNNSGDIVDYRYLMSEANKQAVLKKEDAFDQVLPRMFGSITDRNNSKDINAEAASLLFKEYEDLKNNREHRFLEIGAKTYKRKANGDLVLDANGVPVPDMAAREMWNLLPDTMQHELTQKFGGRHMYIRDDVVNLVMGFRKMSLSRLGENKETGRKSIWGKNSDIVYMAERYWQEAIQLMRVNIAVLTPQVVVSNVASNTALLLSKGIPPDYIRAKSSEAISAMRGYQKTLRARDELAHQIGINQKLGKNTRNLELEWGRLQADVETNPVHQLVEDGLFTSIAEDIGTTSQSTLKKGLDKITDKAQGFVPNALITGAKELYALPGSETYKTAMAVTQYSDFVARFTQFKWQTERKGVDKLTATREAMATFIFYDMPINPKMQYLADTGFFMFPKWALRAQSIIIQIYSQNPAYAFGVFGLQQMLMPKPFNENILNYGLGSGMTHKLTLNPVAKFAETMDLSEPSLLQFVLNPFGL